MSTRPDGLESIEEFMRKHAPPPDLLPKAIWAAAYRAGKQAGEREASSYEHGQRLKEETAEQAWENHVHWRIEATHAPFDINNPTDWADVP